MERSFRNGFGVSTRVAGLAPLAGFVLAGVVIAVDGIGDIRIGGFPWAMAFATLCLAICCLGVLNVHGPRPDPWVLTGGWWTTAAMAGIAGFFIAIAIGGLIDVSEEEAGWLAWPPFLGMVFGVLSMTPALIVLGVGLTRARVLAWWGLTAVWLAAPLLPVLLISGGLAEGDAEEVAIAVPIGLFGLAWVALGGSLARSPT